MMRDRQCIVISEESEFAARVRCRILLPTAASLAAVCSAVAQPCEPQWDAAIGQPGIAHGVGALIGFDDGSGPAIYAGGSFIRAGGATAHSIAKWDGQEWFPLGTGIPELLGGGTGVFSLAVFDDRSGSGPALYVGGEFWKAGGVETNGLARWDGSQWSAIDGWEYGTVTSMIVFDDGFGEALYVAGSFDGSMGRGVAKWDGATWSSLGSGISGSGYGLSDLAVFDDGGGPSLYATGEFSEAGGVSANRIAKWDGSQWAPLGSGVGEPPPEYAFTTALEVFDDGAGPALYVCGYFALAGGEAVISIARWDGAGWSDVGGGLGAPADRGTVYDLEVFDDGSGPALYATGGFDDAGGVRVNNIAKWDGSRWSAPAGPGGELGLDRSGAALRALPEWGDGGALAVGGLFTSAGGLPAYNIALWTGCPDCYADCDGSGELDVFDFLCFQNLFAAGDPQADCDDSGELDIFDFLCFQNEFAAGCP